MTDTIAMTGATGFVGRHTVDALLRAGHRVRALVRNEAQVALPAGVETVLGDLHADAALRTLCDGADCVLHVAGAIKARDRAGFFAANARGTVAVLAAARAAGVTRFVHVSSLAAREPQLSAYAASKRAAEDAVKAADATFRTLIIRPPAVYGPGDRATLPLIKSLTQPIAFIPALPSQRLSLIHVGDLSEILAQAVASARQGLVEVSDGKRDGYSWQELLTLAAAHTGRQVRPVFLPRGLALPVGGLAEAWSRLSGTVGIVNRGKIAELYHPDWVVKETGWPLPRPTGFAQGFAETLAWYRAKGWLPQARGKDRSGLNTSS